FTIDGLAVVDEAHIDLRGVRVVDVADNTRIITRNGRGIAVNALRGKRIRLDGSLAVTGGMKLAGNLEMREGSALRLPAEAEVQIIFSKSRKIDGHAALGAYNYTCIAILCLKSAVSGKLLSRPPLKEPQ
ncbi:MAG: hypothetical protein IKO93_16130, partial [Lentisphaeria bacterium]|nr:hypothetical protein [Lentisphaeria bacterium]